MKAISSLMIVALAAPLLAPSLTAGPKPVPNVTLLVTGLEELQGSTVGPYGAPFGQ